MSKEILNEIKNLNPSARQNLSYDKLVEIVKTLSFKEKIELSSIIGYPVFARMCMGELRHDFVLIQDGSAVIIENDKGEILLQCRADRDKWGLPGGCQELGETFQETIIREIKEETNLNVSQDDLQLIDIVSGLSRLNTYPNGDTVINNTALFYVKNYTGELKCDHESKKLQFFPLDKLPSNQNDLDLIKIYKDKKIYL